VFVEGDRRRWLLDVLDCDSAGLRRAALLVGGTRRTGSIDVRELGPARCTVTLRSTGKVAARYSARVRLAVEPAVA